MPEEPTALTEIAGNTAMGASELATISQRLDDQLREMKLQTALLRQLLVEKR